MSQPCLTRTAVLSALQPAAAFLQEQVSVVTEQQQKQQEQLDARRQVFIRSNQDSQLRPGQEAVLSSMARDCHAEKSTQGKIAWCRAE